MYIFGAEFVRSFRDISIVNYEANCSVGKHGCVHKSICDKVRDDLAETY
jgi:hypothetical protein